MSRVVLKNDIVYSCSLDSMVKAWSITNKKLKYELKNSSWVNDIVIGQEGTPLENRLVSLGGYCGCRLSNLETGTVMKTIKLESNCHSIAVDKTGTIIAVGNGENVTFIETTNFTMVKTVSLNHWVNSLAFNIRNDCMLAVTEGGTVHSFKF